MTTVNVLTFQEALAATQDIRRHLLLGNGFSISLFPDKFRYASLLEETDFSTIPETRQAFDALQTTDFEAVIYALEQSATILSLYSADVQARAKMQQRAAALKELLARAIAGKHPERPSDVSDAQYAACRDFLANFAGDRREKNVRGNIFTLNYDLLLYWTLMHTQPLNPFADEEGKKIGHNDGFLAPDDEPDAEYVTWDGEASHQQNVFYLHGALHLYDYGYELHKLCWERSGGVALIDQVRAALDTSRYPLFVSEGSSKGKFERIRHSGYLHTSLRKFRGACTPKTCCLFIFGHSLSENDSHILKQIEKGKVDSVYIGLHGDPEKINNQAIIAKANQMARARPEKNPLNIYYFDAASANVWGTTP